MIVKIVEKASGSLEAEQWDGTPHPKITYCSCHPGMPSVSGGITKISKGDWIITDTSTGVSWRNTDEAFRARYEVIGP